MLLEDMVIVRCAGWQSSQHSPTAHAAQALCKCFIPLRNQLPGPVPGRCTPVVQASTQRRWIYEPWLAAVI